MDEQPKRTKHDPEPAEITMLIDADDTLWENNIYFLEVTEHFLDLLAGRGVDRDLARTTLIETERKNIPIHGYGSRAFAISVAEAFASLTQESEEEEVQRLQSLARGIFERESLELLPGVQEALEMLAERHRLILVTKGDREEQVRKLAMSALARFFEVVEILPEKDEATYRELVTRLGLDPATTWMVGNSPRSDINPALAAGLNAILVPHPRTWELEIEDVQGDDERLTIVSTFGDVAALFSPAAEQSTGNESNSEIDWAAPEA